MQYQQSLPEIERADHRHLGREFEDDLISTHSVYATQGKALIDRHPSEWEYISKNRYLTMLGNSKTKRLVAVTGDNRYMQRIAANVDFSGVAKISNTKIGLHVKFDAKMSQGKSIPLGNFKRHQVDNLVLSARCGAIAGFLINLYEIERVFFCHASLVQKKMDKNYGKKRAPKGDGSISLAELEQDAYEIPYSRRFVDWLPVLVPRELYNV